MSLIEQIQQDAIDSSSDLGALLRRCKLLAVRLKSQVLEEWLLWESNGYPNDVDVPPYRIWPIDLLGHFAGPFGSGIRNAPIPLACLPEQIRQRYASYKCRQSIASIQSMLDKCQGPLQLSTADLSLILQNKVYRDYNCIQSWGEFDASNLVEVLNAVRNRVLDFSLALCKEAPTVEDNSSYGYGIEPSRITQIFNTTIFGGNASVVGGNPSYVFNITKGDFASLEKMLVEKGVQPEDIKSLRAAVTEESVASGKGMGLKVSLWISRMISKAAQGSWQVGVGAAGKLLAEAISAYYGLP